MTPSQKLELKLGETRRKLAEAIATTDPDMETVEALTAEIRQTDDLLTAQRLVEPEPVTTTSVEGREVLELRQRSTLAGFVQGIHAGKVEGPEAEFRSAVLGDGFEQHHVPLEM